MQRKNDYLNNLYNCDVCGDYGQGNVDEPFDSFLPIDEHQETLSMTCAEERARSHERDENEATERMGLPMEKMKTRSLKCQLRRTEMMVKT